MSAATSSSSATAPRSTTDLARALIWRELVVRYKRSVLGVAWALIEPLSAVAVYVAIFGYVLGAARATDHYPLFTLFGVLPWLFVSATLEQSANTLLEHAPLARKIYFRWELLFVAVVVSRASTLVVGCAAGFLVALFLGVEWSARMLLLPVGLITLVMLTFGLSLVLSAMQTLLRDTAFLVRFVLRLGFYACPIVYPLHMVPERFRAVYELNPLVGAIWLFQAFTGAHEAPSALGLASTAVWTGLSFFGGLALFRRLRDVVADVL